jgi:hypothetical protein
MGGPIRKNTMPKELKDLWNAIRTLGNRTLNNGTTAERPTTVIIGQQYFDTTLGRPIWWDGTEWVDSTGSSI